MACLTEIERAKYEERAAIIEYDGKVSREEAELLAMKEIQSYREQEKLNADM